MGAGAFLRNARKGDEFTAKTYANILGVSPQYLNDIERERRDLPVDRIEEFAMVYMVDVAELFALIVPLPHGYRLVREVA